MVKAEKNRLIIDFYESYRHQIQQKIEDTIIAEEQVLHVSVHSFTPVLNGRVREAEFGILYDPKRKAEKDWAKRFKKELNTRFGQFRARMNYPYLGKADGFTTSLRKKFPEHYLGIELEINQKLLQNIDEMYALKSTLNLCLKNCI